MREKVKITVHRGSHQIGGCCTTIEYKKSRIAIDLGSPLNKKDKGKIHVPGLTYGKKAYDAVFLTHYHDDHVGEAYRALPGIPLYIGACAKDILKAYARVREIDPRRRFLWRRLQGILEGQTVTAGEFRVTAIPSDHSAIDSFMYLIEAGNKRILHTGDFRLHGLRKEELLKGISRLSPIDVLITEGTAILKDTAMSASQGSGVLTGGRSEEWVGAELARKATAYKYCFVLASPSNLDRIRLIGECAAEGKKLVVSRFQNCLMKIAERHGLLDFGERVLPNVILPSGIRGKDFTKKGFVRVIGTGMQSRLTLRYFCKKYTDDTCLIYSTWKGYGNRKKVSRLREVAGEHFYTIHTSGHVKKDDLNTFIETVNPSNIIVIHTECGDVTNSSIACRERIIKVKDGETISV